MCNDNKILLTSHPTPIRNSPFPLMGRQELSLRALHELVSRQEFMALTKMILLAKIKVWYRVFAGRRSFWKVWKYFFKKWFQVKKIKGEKNEEI